MGSRGADKETMVRRFASGQVNHYGAKFGIQVRDPRYPISHITIDCDGIVHGWNVLVYKNTQRKITYTKSLTVFAENVKGSMKVHSVLMRTMQDPIVYDHN